MAMVQSAPTVLAPGNRPGSLPNSGAWRDERHMNQVMAELAIAFAHDIDLANASDETAEEKWPMGLTIAFVVAASAALWAAIAGLVILIF